MGGDIAKVVQKIPARKLPPKARLEYHGTETKPDGKLFSLMRADCILRKKLFATIFSPEGIGAWKAKVESLLHSYKQSTLELVDIMLDCESLEFVPDIYWKKVSKTEYCAQFVYSRKDSRIVLKHSYRNSCNYSYQGKLVISQIKVEGFVWFTYHRNKYLRVSLRDTKVSFGVSYTPDTTWLGFFSSFFFDFEHIAKGELERLIPLFIKESWAEVALHKKMEK